MHVPVRIFFVIALAAGTLAALSNSTAQEPTTRCDPTAGSLGRLSRAQKSAFMRSQDQFIANRYADALAALRDLLAQFPQNTPAWSALAERSAEAAIYAGERTYAISLLKPIEDRDGNDCPARTLLARAYAEEGRSAERDAETSAITELHKQDPNSSFGKLDGFLLEQHRLKGGGAITIAYILRPWGPHNTHLLSEIYDASGKLLLHIELDSDDGDQVYFKETHPDLAAKGERAYALDASGPDPNAPGEMMHYPVLQFFDGAPGYDTVRDRILAIAERATGLDQSGAQQGSPAQGK